jgi:hypothetical protein
MQDIREKIKQVRNFKQYKGKTDAEIEEMLLANEAKKEMLTEITFLIDKDEKKLAQELLDSYLAEYNFSSFSEKDTLKNLVYFEVLGERIKHFINKEYVDKTGAIPTHMVEQLIENSEQITKLKEVLGIGKKKEQDLTWLQSWEDLKKKALTYYESHKGCNTVKCPYCQKIFNLLLRIENLTPEKSSWFRGTILYNEAVFKLYDEKRITTEEAASILGCSVNYITLQYDNIYLKDKNGTKD